MADEPEPSQIATFFKGQTLFVSGVTGFLGKVLLAQILLKMPAVEKIYVLVRGRGDKAAHHRFDKDVWTSDLFKPIIKKEPNARQKVIVVDGDISKAKLGVAPELYEEMANNLTVILHCAATTRFTEPLKDAVELNILGAKRVLDLALVCKKLIAHVHVSTAYVNCVRNSGRSEIREKIYPVRWNPVELLEKLEGMSNEQIEFETETIIAPYPNTYTFTKAVGEHLLLNNRGHVPLCILRPSIVGCSAEDPVPGWMDSMIGASGLLLAVGVGALRAMRGSSTAICDMVPVDTVAFGMLAAAWRTARQYAEAKSDPKAPQIALPIYHMTTSTKNPVFWEWIRTITMGYFRRHPPKKRIGYPWIELIQSPPIYYTGHVLFHILPAAVADAGLMIQGKKPQMLKATSKLHKTITSLAFFTTHSWFYGTDNVDQMNEEMNAEDRRLFPVDVSRINWETYLVIYCDGLKTFLLKEDLGAWSNDDILPYLRKRMADYDISPGIGLKSKL